MDFLLSVIVPVYNVKEYFGICVDSILSQTYKKIELILIDDGSTDGSSEICDKYALDDTRVRVIHKEHGGQASAKNIGLQVATGEYVAFIDSYNWCELDMYEMLIATAFCMHADMVACGGLIETDDSSLAVPSWLKKNLNTVFCIRKGFSVKNFSLKGVGSFNCNKIWRKEIIDANFIKFEDDLDVFGEDIVFLKAILPFCNKTIIIKDKLLHHIFNNESYPFKKYDDDFIVCKEHIKILYLVANQWTQNNIFAKHMKYFFKWSIAFVFGQIDRLQSYVLARDFLSLCNRYGLSYNLYTLSKVEQERFRKIEVYAESDESLRQRLLNRMEKKRLLKQRIRANHFFSNMFDIYWCFRYKGIKSALKMFHIHYKSFERLFIRDIIKFHLMAVMRICRFPFAFKKYSRIPSLKNKNLGESCFVVAPGPSLSLNDLDLIKGIPSFSVNGTMSLSCLTDWRPTHFVLFDGRAYNKLQKELGNVNIDDFSQEEAFINFLLEKKIKSNENAKKAILIPYTTIGNSEKWNVLRLKYSANLLWGHYDLATVTNAAINIAQYMGFSRIFLLGVDCDYSQAKQYFNGVENNVIKDVSDANKAQFRMTTAYNFIKKELEKRGVSVYNATRGGALEVFPRIRLEDAVMQIKEEIKNKEKNNE